MSAGLGLLRLEPRAFWSMTLRELEAALGMVGRRRPGFAPSREVLAELIGRFPD